MPLTDTLTKDADVRWAAEIKKAVGVGDLDKAQRIASAAAKVDIPLRTIKTLGEGSDAVVNLMAGSIPAYTGEQPGLVATKFIQGARRDVPGWSRAKGAIIDLKERDAIARAVPESAKTYGRHAFGPGAIEFQEHMPSTPTPLELNTFARKLKSKLPFGFGDSALWDVNEHGGNVRTDSAGNLKVIDARLRKFKPGIEISEFGKGPSLINKQRAGGGVLAALRNNTKGLNKNVGITLADRLKRLASRSGNKLAPLTPLLYAAPAVSVIGLSALVNHYYPQDATKSKCTKRNGAAKAASDQSADGDVYKESTMSVAPNDNSEQPQSRLMKALGSFGAMFVGNVAEQVGGAAAVPLLHVVAPRANAGKPTIDAMGRMLRRHGIDSHVVDGTNMGSLIDSMFNTKPKPGISITRNAEKGMKGLTTTTYCPALNDISVPKDITELLGFHEAGHVINKHKMGTKAYTAYMLSRKLPGFAALAGAIAPAVTGEKGNPLYPALAGIPIVAEEGTATVRALKEILKRRGFKGMMKNVPAALAQVGGYAAATMGGPALATHLSNKWTTKDKG